MKDTLDIINAPLESTAKSKLIGEILNRYTKERYRTPEEIINKLDKLYAMEEDALQQLKELFNEK